MKTQLAIDRGEFDYATEATRVTTVDDDFDRVAAINGLNESDPEHDYTRSINLALYPKLIGRKSVDIKPIYEGTTIGIPAWMNCDCGVMVMTSDDLHGQATRCGRCFQEAAEGNGGTGRLNIIRRPVTIRPRAERRVLIGLLVFCLVAGSFIGARFLDAPPRVQAEPQSVQLQ